MNVKLFSDYMESFTVCIFYDADGKKICGTANPRKINPKIYDRHITKIKLKGCDHLDVFTDETPDHDTGLYPLADFLGLLDGDIKTEIDNPDEEYLESIDLDGVTLKISTF